jgi:hypothetical protein
MEEEAPEVLSVSVRPQERHQGEGNRRRSVSTGHSRLSQGSGISRFSQGSGRLDPARGSFYRNRMTSGTSSDKRNFTESFSRPGSFFHRPSQKLGSQLGMQLETSASLTEARLSHLGRHTNNCCFMLCFVSVWLKWSSKMWRSCF